ncbi:hypothetical protein Tco_0569500 [Tanacetum coccineum]
MMNGGVEYPRTHSTSPSETYAPCKPLPRVDPFKQLPCLGSTFVSETLRKSDQMHQTFKKSSLAMTHKLDDMIELPKSQSKKTHKEDLEYEVVMVKFPKCMSWLDAYDEPIGDLDMIEDKVDNPSPQSTPQVLPSHEEYTPPVTYPEQINETIGIPMEVEPSNQTQLEDLGLNTCSHNLFRSSRLNAPDVAIAKILVLLLYLPCKARSISRDTIQLEGVVSTIFGEYLLEFTTEYGIPENLHPEVPGLGETIVDFPEGKVGVYTRFFKFANYRILLSQFLFDILGHYQFYLSQLKRLRKNTPQCYTKPLGSLKNWNNRFFWIDERIFPTAVDWRASAPRDEMPIAEMDFFSLIRNPNPFKVKTGMRPRAAYEVPLLTATASHVIDIEDPIVASGSSGTPSTVERSSLDFDNEDPAPLLAEGAGAEEHIQEGLAHEIPPVEIVSTTEVVQEAMHEEEVAATEPPVNKRRKSLAAIGLDAGSTFAPPAAQNTPTAVSDPEPMSYAKPQPHPVQDIAQSSKGAAAEIPTEDVATTKEVRLLKKATAKIARCDQKIQARDEEIKKLDEEIRSIRTVEAEVHGLRNRTQNLETVLEAEVDMKKVAEAKSVDLLVTGEERIKAAFEEFKKFEDEKVEQRCVEMDARLDAQSIDFDEELYPHMLTAIVDRRWFVDGYEACVMDLVSHLWNPGEEPHPPFNKTCITQLSNKARGTNKAIVIRSRLKQDIHFIVNEFTSEVSGKSHKDNANGL